MICPKCKCSVKDNFSLLTVKVSPSKPILYKVVCKECGHEWYSSKFEDKYI
jgi:hypothetical protein